MNPSATRRATSLSSHLGSTDRIFASPKTRQLLAAVDDGLEQIERGLDSELMFADTIADASTRYLLEAGGKRVRPMLILLTAQLGGGNTVDVITAAEAIEITHLASLYHDDVMDDADRRRGVPSAHAVFGNSVAILTGDLLFARASQLMAGLGERAIRLQANTFERLVLGQLHETVGPKDGENEEAHYLQVLADKTGSLIAAAAQAGVIFSGADESYEAAVVEYGEKIGVAFQLIDDVIDLSPQPEETGKVPGTDLRAGVATLPLIHLRVLAETDDEAAALLARIEAEAAGGTDGEASVDFTAAITELRQHPVTTRTLAEAHRWAEDAVTALEPLPDGPVKQALTRFAETIVDRSK
ncbi:polyprenyl synthetase family protein [Mycetocola manganoxydans]|uniref:Polyprenyl synthetase family protein n=1 Tax=Mycetocola manganoxydans TaxID=699879 RepID=A0A3L6ZME9_9MICO|nr:polyprenyl synthetase family protein [Mycetocola manganoxydans]RLP68845.1 polyprenyl synthetase family protein [Mycetocola manganoxydans]GHD51159.1 geranylgeranyl pyrophosphate synthase [Mycetocola manganoxydans]